MKNSTTYVGLDAHKNEHKVTMLLPDSDSPQEWVVKNQQRDIKRMIRQVKKQASGEIVFCYEAGVCGFALKRQIEAEGVGCMVIAPSLIPIKPGQRIKTDRRDARKLAELLRAGLLTEVHPPKSPTRSRWTTGIGLFILANGFWAYLILIVIWFYRSGRPLVPG